MNILSHLVPNICTLYGNPLPTVSSERDLELVTTEILEISSNYIGDIGFNSSYRYTTRTAKHDTDDPESM